MIQEYGVLDYYKWIFSIVESLGMQDSSSEK